MQNLLQLIMRFGAFFLFLLLEFVCLFLVVRYNQSQREIFINSSNLISGSVLEKIDGTFRYLHLNAVSDSLAAENALLISQLVNIPPKMTMSRDTQNLQKSEQVFNFIEARVVNNSINKRNNNLTINKGEKHGLMPGMGVMGVNGIVGVVRNTSANYSSILSLLHSDTRISASIKRNKFFGSLVWRGTSPGIMNLEAIPKHAELLVGDTIQTSGYSHIFPEGIIIGKIKTFNLGSGSNYYTIEVDLNNDLSNVEFVYVIDMLRLSEIEELENRTYE